MSKPNVIPERSQIAPEFTWNTADLYPSDQAWQEDFSRLQAMVPELAAYAGRLGESAGTPCMRTSPWSRRPGSC